MLAFGMSMWVVTLALTLKMRTALSHNTDLYSAYNNGTTSISKIYRSSAQCFATPAPTILAMAHLLSL
jgi:hypothetical protein